MNLALNSNIIISFILLQPVLDLLTSLTIRKTELSLTIGLMVRSLFMIYMIFYIFYTKSHSNKLIKWSKVILLFILGYIIAFLGMSILNEDKSLIIGEIKGLIKAFYFPIVLCGLFVYNAKSKINISNRLLTLTLLGYTSIIFIATITNTYFNSYNRNGFGSVGWFYAANEIGSIIAILIPFTIVNFIQNKVNIVNMVSIITCLLSVIFLGTKVPFLGFAAINGFIILYYIILLIYNKSGKSKVSEFNFKKIVFISISLLALMVLSFPLSPLHKNVQRNYSDIIQRVVNNTSGIDNNKVHNEKNKIEVNKSIEDKNNNPVSKDELTTAMLSNRTVYAQRLKEKFNNSSITKKILGMGYNVEIETINGLYTKKTVELDQLDILYRHGIIGAIIYFTQLIVIILSILKRICTNIKHLLNVDVVISIFSMLLALGIAFTAGHVLTAPGVGFFLIIILIKLYNSTLECNIQ
jgi:hypothetical protein